MSGEKPVVATRPGDDDPLMQKAWDKLHAGGFVVAPDEQSQVSGRTPPDAALTTRIYDLTGDAPLMSEREFAEKALPLLMDAYSALEAAQAERDRLRAGLERILWSCENNRAYSFSAIAEAARAALADSPVSPGNPQDLCAHGCGRDATVQHSDGRTLCQQCYSAEVGLRPGVEGCPTCHEGNPQEANPT